MNENEQLDQKLRDAGMITVAEILQGQPLDAFHKHAGVNSIETFLQWVEMKRAEYQRMHARYDLGEKDKGDDLYEWILSHAGVFAEVHVNLKAALVNRREELSAVETLKRMGYTYNGALLWKPPIGTPPTFDEKEEHF